jgi:hypothetical protein
MATKPTGATFTFSTDANFSSGPASGHPTKVQPAGWPTNLQGFVPGLAYMAEFRNFLFNRLGQWTQWLEAGSSQADADAHIVETDATGKMAVANADVDGILAAGELDVITEARISGSLKIESSLTISGTISPAALGSTVHNWAPTGFAAASMIRITPAAGGTTITGIAGGASGAIKYLINLDTGDEITLAYENASSTAANRIITPGGGAGGHAIQAPGIAMIVYDGASSRWRVLG